MRSTGGNSMPSHAPCWMARTGARRSARSTAIRCRHRWMSRGGAAMPDPQGGEGGKGILDLVPLIRARQKAACAHVHVEVAMDAAELTCTDCGVDLDPWWYIRQQCLEHQAIEAYYQKRVDDHNAWTVKANEIVTRLNAEIAHLVETKNRLSNVSVNGRLLGHVAARSRGGRARK